MSTANQLINGARKPKEKKTKLLALKTKWNSLKRKLSAFNSPQVLGICEKVLTGKPKKPNSANRSIAKVRIKNNKKLVTVYIPGEKHNLQEYSSGLVSGRGAKDLPGVKYRFIRGYKRGDLEGVKERKQGRSLYGAKKGK